MRNEARYLKPTDDKAIRRSDYPPEQVQWYLRMIRELGRLVDLEVLEFPRVRDKKTRRVWG